MKLELIREEFTDKSTIGSLYIDGKFFCYTLEDKDRGLDQKQPLEEITKAKVYGQTAIPTGTYKVTVNLSARLKRELPLIMDVPGYQGIRIHKGNTDVDTLGCVILGTKKGKDAVYQSTIQEQRILSVLKGQKDITITIKHKS